jgi:tetratricopeptide (TPR) repeat protein
MIGRRPVATLSLAACCLVVSQAHGQKEDPPAARQTTRVENPALREQAKALYEQGLAAYRDKKYSDAIDKLLEADRVMPNAAFSYNIALVYEAMGDNRSALRWLRNYLRQSSKGSEETATLGKVRKLEAELQAKGMQQVSIVTNPPGATLSIDGQAVGITPFTTEITPGSHRAAVTLEGYAPTNQTFELRPDRSMDIEIALVAAKVTPIPVAPAPASAAPSKPAIARIEVASPPPVSDRPSRQVQPWTWISLGVGTALFGGAVYFEVKRRDAEDKAKAASQADYQTKYDKMDGPQTAARVLAVVGSVAIATGVVLLTVDLTRRGPTRTAALGSCATGGLCAAMRGEF